MNPEEHNRIVTGALSNFKYAKSKKKSETDLLVEKAMTVTTAVRNHIKPILAAGGAKDPGALRELIARLYLDAFVHFSKDELENLVTILHVEIMMEVIDKDPYGSGTPDAMS
jgi:hypothetical protein